MKRNLVDLVVEEDEVENFAKAVADFFKYVFAHLPAHDGAFSHKEIKKILEGQ